MKNNRTILAVILSLVISACVLTAYLLADTENSDRAEALNPAESTTEARIGDLRILVSGTGEVVPAAEFGLNFDLSGTILDVPVQVGDQVQAGDVLAILQSDRTEAEIAADVAAAELAVVEAQTALNNLYASAEMASAQALIEVETAQLTLDEMQDLTLEKALALQNAAYAQEAIANAEMLLYIYNSSPSEIDIYTAYASWLLKQEILDDLTNQLNTTLYKMKGAPQEHQERMEDQLMQLNLQLANQRLVVEDALYQIASLSTPADPLNVAVAESQLATAQAELAVALDEYERLCEGPNPGEVTLAEAALAKAQAEWQQRHKGPDSEEVFFLETQLEKAMLELEILHQETIIVELVAPIDGMVTDLNLGVGDRIQPDTSSFRNETSSTQTDQDPFTMLFGSSTSTDSDDFQISLADLSLPLLEIYIDESDLIHVDEGYPVEVIFDAFPEEVFLGEIVTVSPMLETVSNFNAVKALVLLDATSFAKPNPFPIGLSAQVDVIAGQTVDAVLLPVEALVAVSPEAYIVYVLENDQPQPRTVEVGLINFTTVEIRSGLSAGETVVLGYGN